MELHLLPILALLCLVLVGSNASTPAEDYWHSALPDTPIPKAIQDLLQFDAGNESPDAKKFSNVKKAFPLVYYSAENRQKLSDVKKAFPLVYYSAENRQKLSDVKKAFPLVYYSAENRQKLSDVKKAFPLVYYSAMKDHNHQKLSDLKKSFPLVYYSAQDDIDAAKADLTHRTLFYKYNSIHPGQKFTLLFDNAGNKVPLLPREVAETVPFSSDRLQDILQLFSIDPNSAEAPIVADTIKDCEDPKRRGEEKYCADSLESLVDQNVARLGKNISVVSTPVAKRQEYTILPGIKMVANDRISICHRERYPYALYYCHEIEETELYSVPLLGADGTRLSAVTICHKDTSGWSQGHIAFVILKMEKPGPPVCHFVAGDTLVWFQTSDLGHVSV